LTTTDSDLKTNFTSKLPAGYYGKLYKEHGLHGAHVIMLGPGNEDAAREALREWDGGLQIGGGIHDQNAKDWIEAGAEKVRLLADKNGQSSAICREPKLILGYVVGDHNILPLS